MLTTEISVLDPGRDFLISLVLGNLTLMIKRDTDFFHSPLIAFLPGKENVIIARYLTSQAQLQKSCKSANWLLVYSEKVSTTGTHLNIGFSALIFHI